MKCLYMEISLFFLMVIRALAFELRVGYSLTLPKSSCLIPTSSFHKNEWRVRLGA